MSDIDSQLGARLKALRARSAQTKPSVTHSQPDDAAARLAALEPPTDAATARAVPVEVKGVDDEVARLLAAVPTSISPPSARASNDSRLNAALDALEATAPQPFASPTGIEVTFTGPPPPGARSLRTEDEDEALIRRLQDELSVEESVKKRGGGEEEGGIAGLESRLRKIKEFKSVDGSGRREPTTEEQQELAKLGTAPRAVEFDDFRKVKRRGSSDEDDSDEGSEDEKSSKDNADEDSEND